MFSPIFLSGVFLFQVYRRPPGMPPATSLTKRTAKARPQASVPLLRKKVIFEMIYQRLNLAIVFNDIQKKLVKKQIGYLHCMSKMARRPATTKEASGSSVTSVSSNHEELVRAYHAHANDTPTTPESGRRNKCGKCTYYAM